MRDLRFDPRILAFAVTALLAVAAEPAGPTIHDAAKASIERKNVRKTEMVGFGIINSAYRDSRGDGSILIGFDVALGLAGDKPTVLAVRPVYSTPRGELVGNPAGSFSSSRNHKVTRSARLVAKPGYAVGGLSLRTGLQIHGMSVTFMAIDGPTLDPKRNYRSEWVGDTNGMNNPTTLSSDGAPVVGVFGNVSGDRAIALGLLVAHPVGEEPEEPAAAPPVVAPPADDDSAPDATDADDFPPESNNQGIWLPIGIGAVVVVGMGAFLMVVSRITLLFPGPPKSSPKSRGPSKSPPPTPKTSSKPEPPVKVIMGDDGIPVIPVWEGN
jgi:hypothetical protein